MWQLCDAVLSKESFNCCSELYRLTGYRSDRSVAALYRRVYANYTHTHTHKCKLCVLFCSRFFSNLLFLFYFKLRKQVINSDNPVIVNFHAEWCDPCKILTPKMLELLENSNEIDLAVIDVEDNLDLVETFEVKAVPAVLAFRNGVVVDKFIGLVDANSIETLIDKLKRKQQQKQ